ncbi:hypothetical protein J3F83DRAFT_322892 [Trichoderma novae-zelandiae]
MVTSGASRRLSAVKHCNRSSNEFRANGLQISRCMAVSRRLIYSHRTFLSQLSAPFTEYIARLEERRTRNTNRVHCAQEASFFSHRAFGVADESLERRHRCRTANFFQFLMIYNISARGSIHHTVPAC